MMYMLATTAGAPQANRHRESLKPTYRTNISHDMSERAALT